MVDQNNSLFTVNSPDPHIAHQTSAHFDSWVAWGCTSISPCSESQEQHTTETGWPHTQEFWESVSKHSFMCFHLFWLKQTAVPPESSCWREGREQKKPWKWKEKNRKHVLTNFCSCWQSLFGHRDTKFTTQRMSMTEEKQAPVVREMTPERKWFPAVGLHERNTKTPFIQQQPAVYWLLTCSNFSHSWGRIDLGFKILLFR